MFIQVRVRRDDGEVIAQFAGKIEPGKELDWRMPLFWPGTIDETKTFYLIGITAMPKTTVIESN